mgnify:CR=1 FL=1
MIYSCHLQPNIVLTSNQQKVKYSYTKQPQPIWMHLINKITIFINYPYQLNLLQNPTIRAFNQILNNAASAPAGNQCAHFGYIEGPEITGT